MVIFVFYKALRGNKITLANNMQQLNAKTVQPQTEAN